jgi:RES domain-containing protein
VLEVLVHMDDEDMASNYVAIPADIPDRVEITRVRASDLPRDWRSLPRPSALADLGSRWARAGAGAVLAVPSVVIPQDLNYLLNPLHPAFKRIRLGRPEPFAFDRRVWKKTK